MSHGSTCATFTIKISAKIEKGAVMVSNWLAEHWHWLILVGGIIWLLGGLYGAYALFNFLSRRNPFPEKFRAFLNSLSQSITFGISGAIIGALAIFPLALILFLFALFSYVLFLLAPVVNYPVTLVYQAAGGFSMLLIGLTLGAIIGFLTGFLYKQGKEAVVSPRKFSQKNGLLLLIGVILVGLFIVYELFTDQSDSGLFIAIIELYGLVVGAIFDRIKISWPLFTLLLIISFTLFLFVIKQFHMFTYFIHITESLSLLLAIFVLCSLTGYVFFNPLRTRNADPSWKKFLLWLGIGSVSAILLTWFSHFFLSNVADFTVPASSIGILIGIGNGEAKKLIQKKPEYSLDKRLNNNRPPSRAMRFWRSLFITFLCLYVAFLLLLYNLIIYDNILANLDAILVKGYSLTADDLVVYHYLVLFIVPLFFVLPIALSSGSVQGYGYMIVDRVKRLADGWLGVIGFGLAAFGTILMTLPSLFS